MEYMTNTTQTNTRKDRISSTTMDIFGYHAWDYWKGFRLSNGRMVYGLMAICSYTAGYVWYHVKNIWKAN